MVFRFTIINYFIGHTACQFVLFSVPSRQILQHFLQVTGLQSIVEYENVFCIYKQANSLNAEDWFIALHTRVSCVIRALY